MSTVAGSTLLAIASTFSPWLLVGDSGPGAAELVAAPTGRGWARPVVAHGQGDPRPGPSCHNGCCNQRGYPGEGRLPAAATTLVVPVPVRATPAALVAPSAVSPGATATRGRPAAPLLATAALTGTRAGRAGTAPLLATAALTGTWASRAGTAPLLAPAALTGTWAGRAGTAPLRATLASPLPRGAAAPLTGTAVAPLAGVLPTLLELRHSRRTSLRNR